MRPAVFCWSPKLYFTSCAPSRLRRSVTLRVCGARFVAPYTRSLRIHLTEFATDLQFCSDINGLGAKPEPAGVNERALFANQPVTIQSVY